MTPRAASSSPLITVTEAGTVSTSSGVRVAVTWIVSATVGAGSWGASWALTGNREVVTPRAAANATGNASPRTAMETVMRELLLLNGRAMNDG